MNILYTLSGFGFGHATRSRVVIERLKSLGHFVKIATYGQSFEYFKNFFPDDLVEIRGLKSQFIGGKISVSKILLEIIRNAPSIFFTQNFPIFKKIIKNFKIDAVFNDFEPSSRWLTRTMGIPMVTIDNQFLSHICKIDVPTKFVKDFFVINTMMSLFYPWGDWRFVVSFTPQLTPAKKRYSPNTFIVPPILREEIFNLKPQKDDFILVYQTVPIYRKQLLSVFQNANEKFICYNLGKPLVFKNIIFKNFSEKEFLNDLSRTKAVILNGGFTVMSEAIYLQKPILSLPIKGDFEQILNGLVLQKSGYGVFCEELDEEVIKNFLANLPKFEAKLAEYQQEKNSIFEKKLQRVLRKIEFGE